MVSEYRERKLGLNAELVTPIEMFRAADFGVGSLTSSHLSAALEIRQVSSPTRLRMLNLEMSNQAVGWIEFEFRDGGLSGGRVLGPYRLLGSQRLPLKTDEVIGRHFTSSISVAFLSSYVANALGGSGNAEVKINASWIAEPTDAYGL